MKLWIVAGLLASVTADVRNAPDIRAAEKFAEEFKTRNGVTSEYLQAYSWLARRSLAEHKLDAAARFADETYKLATAKLKQRPLDADRELPIALGAAIEVKALVAAERGERSEAVSFLRSELEQYRHTSIRTRIQKNINVLTLEGKVAPPIDRVEWLAMRPLPLAAYRGRPVLLFFWAHWCPDCKRQAPIIAQLKHDFPQLEVIAPTRRFGYAESGREVSSSEELSYIDRVRKEFYGSIQELAVPVSDETFMNYGASTTPTLVLIDRSGLIRLYHPGVLTYDELVSKLKPVLTYPQHKAAAGNKRGA